MSSQRALIDGDLAVYMACAACQISLDFDDGNGDATPYADIDETMKAVDKLIWKWAKAVSPNRSFIVCFSDDVNYRKQLLPSYKSNRDGVERPILLKEVREGLEDEYTTRVMPGLEADDVMGIYATASSQYVIVSRDKDMATVPGWVFNPDRHKKPVKVGRVYADNHVLRQGMTGDTVDGYSGIPGVGPKTATEILEKPRLLEPTSRTITRGKRKGQVEVKWSPGAYCSQWEAMVSHAARAGMTENDLITQVRLARILRSGEYNEENGEVTLWHPRGKRETMKIEGI